MTVGSGRRLRVVPPLPGQLSLDLPGIPTVDQLAQQVAGVDAARPCPAPPGQPGQPGQPVRLVPTRDADRVGPAVTARVPVAVWAVWDGDDLVGVYAQESTARGDAAVLRRDAVRAGTRPGSVDCLPLRVFTESQHIHR